MWKLIWKDSLHFDPSINDSLMFLPMFPTLINLFLLGDISVYEDIFFLYFLFILVILIIFPIKLAKGLYLCPLTEDERKKYLMTACYLRLGVLMFLLGIILFISRIFLKTDNLILLLQFIYTGIAILGMILLFLLCGTDSMNMAKHRYYIAQGLPVPKKPKLVQLERKTAIYSNLIPIIALVLGLLGVILLMNDKEFNSYLWLYYIPSFLISIVCFIVYFRKYFDDVITISTNRENFHYLKKKAGAFHAD